MKRAIITTTINSPTEAIHKYLEIARRDGWYLIVVGDKKTPYSDWKDIERSNLDIVHYLDPKDQEAIDKELSDMIGWNCIQRRNFGFLKALQLGVHYIATIDDDNIPLDNWGKEIYVNSSVEVDIYTHNNPETKVIDPLSLWDTYNIWHRGFPLDLVEDKNNIRHVRSELITVNVQANLWDGDPDIDAIQRLSKGIVEYEFGEFDPFAFDKISPFNSQNTIISSSVLDKYMCLPHVGRMDDIWGSYLLQMTCPNSQPIYCSATVKQERNVHNFHNDFINEIIGYKVKSKDLTNPWNLLPTNTKMAYLRYRQAIENIRKEYKHA